MTKTSIKNVHVEGKVIMKKRLGGHKTPMERLFDIVCQVAVAGGHRSFDQVDQIKDKEYNIRDTRELHHSTSIRKMGSDSFKDEASFSQWGRKLVPEGAHNITGEELLIRILDAAVDNPINFKSSYAASQKKEEGSNDVDNLNELKSSDDIFVNSDYGTLQEEFRNGLISKKEYSDRLKILKKSFK